jgi:hypothetical protein
VKQLKLLMVLAGVMAWALVGCTRAPQALSDEQAFQRFVGTWENPEAQGEQTYSKLTVQPDRMVEAWVRPDSPRAREFSAKLKKTWVDAEGATFCQFFFAYIDGTKYQGQGLMRVDKARKVLELNKKFGKEEDPYPSQIERQNPGPNWALYMILYRK